MPLTARYEPPHPPTEVAAFGGDFSEILPPGIDLQSGALAIFTNANPPVAADTQWTNSTPGGQVYIRGSKIFAIMTGGTAGTDYQFVWTVIDTRGNTWSRTALILCTLTS
jgi:hypothetical protein